MAWGDTEQKKDLSLIRENLDDLDPQPVYKDRAALRVHLDLMISNCKRYNGAETEFWQAADAMEKFIAEIFSKKDEEEAAASLSGGGGGAT